MDMHACHVIAGEAASAVQELAAARFLSPPNVEVKFHGITEAKTLPLIPTYLYYILIELLKNSIRATGTKWERNGKKRSVTSPSR